MERTWVALAQTKSRSLRTTIPAAFVRTLGIEKGTELGWDLKPEDGRFALIVRVINGEDAPKPKSGARKARKKGGGM